MIKMIDKMKKYKKILLLLMLSLVVFCACSKKESYSNELKWPEDETTIYISSDFHWQKEDDNFRLDYLDETLLALFDEASDGKAAALIVCGDITNGGKIEEHLEIAKMLKSAEDRGANIFVVMGNHDMDSGLNPETLKEVYADFGFNTAFSRDENTMSYVSVLNDEIWLLSLDLNVYGDIESDMAGYISEDTLLWIEDILIRAENEGAMVVPFSHHNLIEHAMEDLTHHYNIENSQELQELLLNYNVPIYLSGHRHSSFITSIEKNGRRIDELVIDMPASYPYRYSRITFKQNNTIDYDLNKIDIVSWTKNNGIEDENLLNFDEYSKTEFDNRLIENSISIEKLTDDKEEVEKLKTFYIDVLTAQKERTLWQNYQEYKQNPALDLWEKYADENIFGRWLPWILINQTNDQPSQILGPYN